MRPRLFIAAFFALLPLLVFHRALFLGEAFLPADQLRHLAPWRGQTPPPLAWNVLRFDGITQFYPWRLQLIREWRAGHLPVTNPYAFAAEGGTPLLANSQSAPFYPPNLLFVALGEPNAWYGFGLLAALHLLVAALGTYRFARSLGLSRTAGLFSTLTFCLSGPVVCWLALPTFLCASAWLPWLLLAIRRAHQPHGGKATLAAAALGGLVLLSGHLQIALYVLLTAGAYTLTLGAQGLRRKQLSLGRWCAGVSLATLVAVGLALPQVLPALALSRQSHRASKSAPTFESYQAWSTTALPPQSVLTFTIPDFFGHPNRNEGLYWNANRTVQGRPVLNNYAEWALYVGVIPLLLACLGLRTQRFFALTAGLTLLMAFGTWANLPFFFLVPGWSQTGNPGRILVISAFALSLLGGAGLDALPLTSLKQRAGALLVVVFSLVVGLSLALQHANFLAVPWGIALAQAQPALALALTWLTLGALGLFLAPRYRGGRPLLLLLSLLDLTVWGWGYNPTSPAKAVYPVTPGIAWLQANAKDALIAPLNDAWSLAPTAPRQAALPPNALTVYQLHDLAGYDSLFLARAKQRIQDATGSDPCPPENGNMVFIKSAEAALALGARYLVVAPERSLSLDLKRVYDGPDLTIYENPEGRDAPRTDRRVPTELRLGLVAMALSALSLALGLLALRRSPSPTPPRS